MKKWVVVFAIITKYLYMCIYAHVTLGGKQKYYMTIWGNKSHLHAVNQTFGLPYIHIN